MSSRPGVSKTTIKAKDLSDRCSATLRFPHAPYLGVRCMMKPDHADRTKHRAVTKVPTGTAVPAPRRPAEMVTVEMYWETSS